MTRNAVGRIGRSGNLRIMSAPAELPLTLIEKRIIDEALEQYQSSLRKDRQNYSQYRDVVMSVEKQIDVVFDLRRKVKKM